MKKVSIIIPVYNMEDWVESGIKCITEQTYENLEIIIIDDGSKDGSYMKCLAEADKDRRIAVFGKNNEGPGAARNLALRKATGVYIYFFDIDDYLEKNEIEKFVQKLENLYPSIQYVNRLTTHSWGQKVVRFYDLDGNLIEVGTPM